MRKGNEILTIAELHGDFNNGIFVNDTYLEYFDSITLYFKEKSKFYHALPDLEKPDHYFRIEYKVNDYKTAITVMESKK